MSTAAGTLHRTTPQLWTNQRPVADTYSNKRNINGFLVFPATRSAVPTGVSRDVADQLYIRGGGVAIIHRDHLKIEQLKIENTDPAVDVIWLSVTSQGRSLVLGVIYRPPDSSIPNVLDSIGRQLQEARHFQKVSLCSYSAI